jgi:hypothetical protein
MTVSLSEEPSRTRGAAAASAPIELRWQVVMPWLALVAILLTATRPDPDLWGHLRFGLDWLRTGTLPSVDPYSFTQDKPWINHEWLSEVLTAAAYSAAGIAGLVLLKSAVIGALLAILWRSLRGGTPVVRVSTVTAALVGVLPISGTVRPQIWSVLGLVILATVLRPEPPSWRRIAGSGLLFAAWANLHGGWITGGTVLGLYVAIRVVRAPRHALRWLMLGAVSLGATLVNPYGAGLWMFLATTVRSSRPDISEWAPFSLSEPILMWVSILGPSLVLARLYQRRATRPPIEIAACVLLMLAAGLRVSRVAPLMCPAALTLLAPQIVRAWGDKGRLTVPSRPAAAILLIPAVFAMLTTGAPVGRVLTCLPISDAWAPDRDAAAQLRGLSGRLWTTFDWGEYAIWHLGPDLRVSVDGGRETVYSDDLLEWTRAVERGDGAAIQRLKSIGTDYVWLPASRSAARSALEENGYRVDFQTDASFVAVRAGVPRLPSTATALPPCFP